MASDPSKSPLAGGVLIAVGAMAGVGVGLFQPIGPAVGFLIGLAAGAAISLAMWLNDVRRNRR